MTNYNNHRMPTLKELCFRSMAVDCFRRYILQHSSSFDYQDPAEMEGRSIYFEYAKLHPLMKHRLSSSLKKMREEVTRWSDKHTELLADNKRGLKANLLKLYFDQIVWSASNVEINDKATAINIAFFGSEDWPKFKFQFACAYAFEELLISFDQIQLKAFAQRLPNHPLYEFWFDHMLPAKTTDIPLNENPNLAPKLTVCNAFEWAVRHGYLELIQYFWKNVSLVQAEYLGMLNLRRLCISRMKHNHMFRFIMNELFDLNPVITGKILARIILAKLAETLNHKFVVKDPIKLQEVYEEAVEVLRSVLDNCDPQLRLHILSADDFHAFVMACLHKDANVFRLLCSYLSKRPSDDLKLRLQSKLDAVLTEECMSEFFLKILIRE